MKKIVVRYKNYPKNDKRYMKVVNISTRNKLIRSVYANICTAYTFESPLMKETIEKYKDVPLTKHKLTPNERGMLKRQPSATDCIPVWEVKDYDKLVCSNEFESQLKDEFVVRFLKAEPAIVNLINRSSKIYFAEIVEE